MFYTLVVFCEFLPRTLLLFRVNLTFFFVQPPDNATRSLWLPLEENLAGHIPSERLSNEIDISNQNMSSKITKPISNTPQYSKCHMYVDGQNHSLGQQSCINGYEFHFENSNEWNIVAEWGLVCNRQ